MFGSPPPSPDYTGAAREQAAAGRQLTAEQTYANRPDITTPWGGMRWTPPTFDPAFATGGAGAMGTGGGGGGGSSPGFPNPLTALGGAFGGGGGGGSISGFASEWRNRLADRFREQGQPQGPGGGQPGRWGMEVFLSPEQQAALEAQQRIQRGRSDVAESLLGRARGELGQAPDFSALPDFGGEVAPQDVGGELPDVGALRNRAEQALYERASSRLDPEWKQREEQLDMRLRSQGILPGSAAYAQQAQQLERAREAAYSGARQEAITGGGAEAQRQFGMGLSARQQAASEAGQRFGQRLQASEYGTQRRQAQLAEMLQRRGWSLNEINALLTGQQVGMPQTPGFSQAGVSQAPNLLGAMGQQYQAGLNAYNAQQAQLQSLLSGGFGLAGTALPFMF